ncbi:MAG: PP2C family protein-serine/threonine phosphatase [Planctomycetaceae bacterium]
MTAIAAATHDLLPELFGRFEEATGWRLHFRALDGPYEERQQALERDPGCCWSTVISDGHRPAAFLWLDRPKDTEPAITQFDACRLAEAVAKLFERLAAAAAQLALRNKDVSMLLDLGLKIPAQDDLSFALSQLFKAATHLTNARGAAFFLLDSSATRLNLRGVYQLARNEIPRAERELCAGSPDLRALLDQPTALRADRPGGLPWLPATMQVALVTGVQSEQAPFGTLWVYDRRDKQFSQRDRHVLQSIAAQLAAVLERSALLRGSEQQERISRDLRAASRAQCDIDPRDVPEDPRFEIAGRCTSCYELGGDLCEVLRLPGGRVGLAVGDASGNSVPAAMIMSAVRGALRAHPAGADDVAARTVEINQALCQITHSHQFMSLCYGVFDPQTRTFDYCNAGHPAPVLVRDGQARMLDSHGLLLGVLPDAAYDHSALQLDRGDVLVLYSDGISEARRDEHNLFRASGIIAAVNQTADWSAQQILDAVWNRVDRHLSPGQLPDDRTLLVLKLR